MISIGAIFQPSGSVIPFGKKRATVRKLRRRASGKRQEDETRIVVSHGPSEPQCPFAISAGLYGCTRPLVWLGLVVPRNHRVRLSPSARVSTTC